MALTDESVTRKTVTVLFCDVVGSTDLGERVDPETTRRVMLRYFDEARGALERHGGTVEKFIGDAVMAVFGVPLVHEDDALRAVAAAEELRQRLETLNVELEQRWGLRLEWRIGINTGEVVVGDPTSTQTIASGDTVNVAARLQQAARPGEILLGPTTHRLVASRVSAGPLETFSLRGRSEAVNMWRLDEVRSDAERIFQRLESPLAGREHERDLLHRLYKEALDEQTCRIVTVLGEAGIGKSRLAQEVAAHVFGATVAHGRCLPYGDGITFSPVSDVVRSLIGIAADDAPERVAALVAEALPAPEAVDVAARLEGVLGVGGEVQAEEAFWAVRRLLEAFARSRPLVLVFEDLHWAEPTLLDLIEYLVGWTHGAPILIVCLARPELLDNRPAWPGIRIALGPLEPEDVRALLGNVLGGGEVDARVETRIAEAADGNPLFVEELARMLVDEQAVVLEEGRWVLAPEAAPAIPPTISALLAARLDRLPPAERAVLQCASVIGKEFWWGAVAELAPAEVRDRVGAHLQSLVRKRLVAPAESTSFATDDAFRFGHILVRDAAYAALSKEVRATLHERFADWLEQKDGPEEIRGYHLDRAYVALAELGAIGDEQRALGERAGELLASAGTRAFGREDMSAAVRLLSRAVELLPPDARRREQTRTLTAALWATGEHERSGDLLAQLRTEAEAAGDLRMEWHARVDQAGQAQDAAALEEAARAGLEVFEDLGDEVGVARARRWLASAANRRCAFVAAEAESEQAIEHAIVAGDRREEARAVDALCTALLYGPTPAADGIRRCTELLARAPGNLLMEANVHTSLSGLSAMTGDIEAARSSYHRAHAVYGELGLRLLTAALTAITGQIELAAGNPVAAEQELRLGIALLSERPYADAIAYRSALLALALEAQQRHAEADAALGEHEPADLVARIVSLTARARVRGDLEAARRAVDLAAGTDAITLEADARATLGGLLDVQGHSAATELALARALYERKGNGLAVRLLAEPLQI